ncbi:DUF4255 domain-containing protein [Micromonospora sp. NPDC005299]|uniref:DUF4255 domain-containing protein n=1 Tax=Micromonospora sp. NPDC005299 TaxID=3364231 RepID=UPI0036D165C9
MFADLDATLQAMLDDPTAPADLRTADVSFVTPDRDYKPPQATINLYLHEVTENRALRDEARVMERTGTVWSSRLPSLRVDCSYLVTAWSADTGGLKVANEHRLLGLALMWFSRFPVIADRFLQGSLKHPPQPFPLPSVVAQTGEGQAMGHFWTALGTPPRPAFSVTVTITVDPFDQVEQFAAVERLHIDTGSITDPRLGGRVLDAALSAVPGVVVSVVGTPLTAATDVAGRFALPGLEAGACTLRVQRTGAPDLDVAVTYAVDRQFHDVVLPTP